MSHSSTATPANLPQLLLLSAPVDSIHLPPYSLNDDLDLNWFWQFVWFFSFLVFCFSAGSFIERHPAQHIFMQKGHYLHALRSTTGQLCRGQKIGSLYVYFFSTQLFLSQIVWIRSSCLPYDSSLFIPPPAVAANCQNKHIKTFIVRGFTSFRSPLMLWAARDGTDLTL